MRIGFIGLGNMGMPMAANLAAAGHEVTGYDVSDVRPDSLNMASSAAAAATGRDAVITMLPDGGTLRQVAADIIPVMAAGSALIDCSTVDVDSARDVAAMAGEAGLLAVDAPVSGGVGGARSGSLTFMAGGPDAGFALAAPLFEIMGAKAVHCGGSGAGQAQSVQHLVTHPLAQSAIQAGIRLIQQNQLWGGRKGTCQGHPLLLAAG